MTTARKGAAASTLNGKIYVMGGLDDKGNSLNSVEYYDPATKKWAAAAKMGTARYYFSAATLNGKIYVMGGNNLSSVEYYDPAAKTWADAAKMGTARAGAAASALNGKIYVMGGGLLATIEYFTPGPQLINGSSQWTKDSPYQLGKNENCFVTGCPQAMCVPGTKSLISARTYDEDGIVYTMNDAQKTICISVMDFCPTDIYSTGYQIWWPRFYDAILNAVVTRKLNVRVLVSKWAYSSHVQESYFADLLKLSQVCQIAQKDPNWSGLLGTGTNCPKGGDSSTCFPGKIACGTLEVREIALSGWDQTQGKNPVYTSHSRVNHTKYLVTDRRANIGTSNWTWGYFYNTAGSSFNTNSSEVIKGMQSIFDRDWNSSYSYKLGTVGKKQRLFFWVIVGIIITLGMILIIYGIVKFIKKD